MSGDSTGPVIVKLRVDGFDQTRERTIEISRTWWDEMSPQQRREYVQRESDAFTAGYVYSGWQFEDPTDYDAAGFIIPEPGKVQL